MSNAPILVGYEWRSIEGERYSSYEGGLVNCKVSDWENYEVSFGSGRKIVHVYFIKDETGIHPYGKTSAMKKLGIPSSKNLDRIATKFYKEIEAKRIRFKKWVHEAKTSGYNSATEAIAAHNIAWCRRSPLTGERTTFPLEMKELMSNGEKFFFVLKTDNEATEALQNDGWNKVDIEIK